MRKLDINSVDLNLLKLLDALLKERSVTRAGQNVGLSQPAASRGLARLRQLLNDPLLVRTSHGLELTPRASDLAELVSRVLEDARAIVAPAIFNPRDAVGRFAIAMTDHQTLLLMPKLIAKLGQLAPTMDVEISALSGSDVDLVAQGDVDLAIGVYGKLPARFRNRTLYHEDLVCVVRSDHPVLKEKWTLERYLALSHITVIITGYGSSAVDKALAEQGLSRRAAVRLPHFLAAPMLVTESDMILSLPRRLAQRLATLLSIQILEIPLEISNFNLSMIWHERRHDDSAHKWLRHLIMEIASEIKAS